MIPEVTAAIEDLRLTYPGCSATSVDDTFGKAYVTVEPLDPGPSFVQNETWVKFHITNTHPSADIYPHFVRPDLARLDGLALVAPLSGGSNFQGTPAVQISRRNNRHDPERDTAAVKLGKVLAWLKSQ